MARGLANAHGKSDACDSCLSLADLKRLSEFEGVIHPPLSIMRFILYFATARAARSDAEAAGTPRWKYDVYRFPRYPVCAWYCGVGGFLGIGPVITKAWGYEGRYLPNSHFLSQGVDS